MKYYIINDKKHYNSIDGLRALACLGIILMHIEANTEYRLNGSFLFDRCIPSLTWLVYLFFIISGFWYVCRLFGEILEGNNRPRNLL